MKNTNFKVRAVYGSLYTVIGNGERYLNVSLRCNADPDGFTTVQVIITKDTKGQVSVAWQHNDLTDGRTNIASYDLEYNLPHEGFWSVVKDHINQLAAGEFPLEYVEYDF